LLQKERSKLALRGLSAEGAGMPTDFVGDLCREGAAIGGSVQPQSFWTFRTKQKAELPQTLVGADPIGLDRPGPRPNYFTAGDLPHRCQIAR
jgi:hypothetical protein